MNCCEKVIFEGVLVSIHCSLMTLAKILHGAVETDRRELSAHVCFKHPSQTCGLGLRRPGSMWPVQDESEQGVLGACFGCPK